MKILLSVLILAASSLVAAQTPCGVTMNDPCWIGGATPPPVLRRWPEILTDSLWATATAADVDLSYRCIQAHTCHEGNPFNPIKNAVGPAIIFQVGMTGLSMWGFHHWRKSYPRFAYIIPAVNITGHALGIWSYMRGR